MQALLIPLFSFIIAGVISRVLLALGIGFATYSGIEALIGQLLDLVQPAINSLPGAVVQLLSISGFPQAFSIVSAAFMARAAIQAMRVFVSATSLGG